MEHNNDPKHRSKSTILTIQNSLEVFLSKVKYLLLGKSVFLSAVLIKSDKLKFQISPNIAITSQKLKKAI